MSDAMGYIRKMEKEQRKVESSRIDDLDFELIEIMAWIEDRVAKIPDQDKKHLIEYLRKYS